MRKFLLQVIMTILVRVDDLDETELRYWFGIPEDVSAYLNALKEKVKLPIAEIKSEIWEHMFCEMSDRSEYVSSEILKIFCEPADKICSATVEVQMESMAHRGSFRKELLPEDSNFKGWSPKLHDVIEEASTELSKDIANMLVAIAEAYYNNSEGGGDPQYGIRRNNQSSQTGA